VNAGRLVENYEKVLLGWGLCALVIAVAIRVGLGWLLARQIWLLDSQALLIPLLIAIAIAAGLFLGGSYSVPTSVLLGILAWAVVLSLIPRSLWWQATALRGPLPDWLVYCGPGLLLLALITRGVMTRRWLGQLRGHGHEWILDWARGRPYFARLLAARVLAGLGYRG
jgi:hypothetical protein